ncbi:hypothetical protein ACI65C_011789 [Semiaphis heraclei]
MSGLQKWIFASLLLAHAVLETHQVEEREEFTFPFKIYARSLVDYGLVRGLVLFDLLTDSTFVLKQRLISSHALLKQHVD